MRSFLLGMAAVGHAAAQPAEGPAWRMASARVATGLTRPVFACSPPGDASRLFICELYRDFSAPALADIKVLRLDSGVINHEPFLTVQVASGGETGLLGMAFDPGYRQNGRFYIHYSRYSPRGSRIVRYTVSSNPDIADPSSETEVLFVPQTASSHQGGWLEFGPEGLLHFSLGDGEVQGSSQTLTDLRGKVGRIDVRQLPYSIPPANPFAGSATARQEILAYGLRNPFRCSLDRATGDLWIGDVGEVQYEEIDFLASPGAGVPAAPNYGWPCSDGPINACPPTTTVTLPVYTYTHTTANPEYVIGGCVYRGAAMPELRGTYFLWRRGPDLMTSFRYGNGAITEFTDRTAELTPPTGPLSYIVAFGQDSAGEMYLPSLTTGDVFKIVPRCWANCDGSGQAPVLNGADFSCFMGMFAAGDPYANCDGSTIPPTLNVGDFLCFINRFAAGCS